MYNQDNANYDYDGEEYWAEHDEPAYHSDYLEQIRKVSKQACLHKGCPDCRGTGRKHNGEMCVHMLSCSCVRCSPGRMVCRGKFNAS